VDAVRRTSITLPSERLASSRTELLKANLGKRVRIVYQDATRPPLVGKLTHLATDLLTLQTDAGATLVLPGVPTDARIEFLEASTLKAGADSTVAQIELKLRKPVTQQPIRAYFAARGLGWAPAYRIQLLGDNKAKITLRAALLNDGPPLVNTDVKFTVGVAKFAYGSVEDPLTSRTNFAQLMGQLYNAEGGGGLYAASPMPNVAMQTRAKAEGYAMEDEAVYDLAELAITTDRPTSETDNLFFYQVRGVTLFKGERGQFDLLEAEIAYEDLYEAELPGNQPQYYFYHQDQAGVKHQVWHAIRLTNSGETPWTTAPAVVLATEGNKLEPVAQEMLPYTAPKDRTLLRLTTAPDLQVEQTERELSRREGIKRNRAEYDLLTIEATVEVKSFKKKEVKLNLTRGIVGELESSEVQCDVKANETAGAVLNPRSKLSWDVQLKPGEKRTFTYKYKVYVRK
jgi:hypothetical protein